MASLRLVIVGLVGLAGVALGAFFVFPQPIDDFARVRVGEHTFVAEIADSSQERTQGLSGRPPGAGKETMLFLFEKEERHAIWMRQMQFPLDILWIRDSVVVDTEAFAPPPREGTPDAFLPLYIPDVAADAVLEIPAGTVARKNIRIGDRVTAVYRKEELLARLKTPLKNPSPLHPAQKYAIEILREERRRGSNFHIEQELPGNTYYKKFLVSWRTGELTITGVMNIPDTAPPKKGFPLLILNHGLIDTAVYVSGRGSRREQDFFTRNGYITIHPDYRGHASSTPNPESHHDFYVGYSEDVVALIDALKERSLPLVDMSRIGMWGHSMGGGIGARVAVLVPEVRAFVLFAPISADVEDNFYELSDKEVAWLHEQYGPAGDSIYEKISPIAYFGDVGAPFQLHHGTADRDVPIRFSEMMVERLTALKKRVEFYRYEGEQHEFGSLWELAAERSLQFFDMYVKKK